MSCNHPNTWRACAALGWLLRASMRAYRINSARSLSRGSDRSWPRCRRRPSETIMCLAIPMRVDRIEGFLAQCSIKGVSREVNLFLLQDQDVSVGDHVLVHLGYAIQLIDEREAKSTWEVFDAMLIAGDNDSHA